MVDFDTETPPTGQERKRPRACFLRPWYVKGGGKATAMGTIRSESETSEFSKVMNFSLILSTRAVYCDEPCADEARPEVLPVPEVEVEAIMSDLVSAVAVVSSKSPAPTDERYISYSLPYAHLYILCQRNTNANLVTRFVSIHTVRVTEEYRYPL